MNAILSLTAKRFGIVGSAVAFLLLGAARNIAQQQSPSSLAPVGVVAFQIEGQEISYAETSKLAPVVSHQVVAVRGDGSHMWSMEDESPLKEKGRFSEIFNASKQTYQRTEPFTASVTTLLFPSSTEYRSNDVDKFGCTEQQLMAANSSAESATILGYRVVPITNTESDGTQTVDWIAPAVGCYHLRRSEISKFGSRNEFTVTNVTVGEPAADLFMPPADYVERSPGEVEALYFAKYGKHLFDDASTLERLNRDYYAHQRR